MRGLVAALGAVLVGGVAALAALVPAEAKEVKEFEIGQWAGFVFTDDATGQFSDCTIWAANSAEIYLGISVNKNWTLELYLNSKAWNLPLDGSYPVSYWIDRNPIYHGKAATYSEHYAQIAVERGQAVFDELRGGNQLTFRTQSEDYVFNLNGSRAALNRVLDCVEEYTKQASTNPFGGGGGSNDQQSGGGQSAQPFGDGEQQGGGGSSSNDQAGTSMKLKDLTLSTDDVRRFLVDVTGAKPSMVTIDPKTFKSGYPYYMFSTPIGAGSFWQEHLGDDTLRGAVDFYLNTYKEECKGDFNQSVQDPIQGDRGAVILGSATCSNSPYQNGGAEVLSYVLTITSGDVLSIYATYVGGNAAKAKTDNLGKLIARRQEAEVK